MVKNSPAVMEAFKKAFDELSALSEEEFHTLIYDTELGDVGKFMMESGAAELVLYHINHKWDDENEECSCGCSPYDPCFHRGCPHCDLPENQQFIRGGE